MPTLPQALRSRVPVRLRDDPRLRTFVLGVGLIPPRTMHSEQDLALLAQGVRGARRIVEIGVYEGGSALALMRLAPPGAELHLIDPFGQHADALPAGWGASEWATRRTVAAEARRLGAHAPLVRWHVMTSKAAAARWGDGTLVDFVFIDGDHSEHGCEADWLAWSPLVAPGGRVAFHDARAGAPGGRGLPGPTAVVARLFGDAAHPGWTVLGQLDRTVLVERSSAVTGDAADDSL